MSTLSEEQVEMLAGLADLLAKGTKTKAANTVHDAVRLHGDGGLFNHPGLERDIITAMVRPFGIGSALPLFPSVTEDPRFGALTGIEEIAGLEPDEACEDAPTGYIKAAKLTAKFGMIRRDTNTIEMDKVMLKLNRGDHTDLVLRGKVLGLSNLEPSGMDQSQIIDIITMSEMVNTAVRAERILNRQIWQGSPLVGTEFPGLDSQIATGIVDADSGIAAPSLDSDVKNFALNNVDGSTGNDIVEYLSMLEWYLRYNAMTMGLDPVSWVVVMRPELWFELTKSWPCAYHTSKCAPSVATNGSVVIDGRENTRERDLMRNGMYIDINGNRYPVVVDTGVFEKNSTNSAGLAPGEFASSIYMVPLTITGGFPVTYREYVDYRQAIPDVRLMRGKEDFFWTDQGVYSWAIEQIKWCYKFALKTEQRVILRTPQLAGRIDDVMYSPLQHLRDVDPGSPYFLDGGTSLGDHRPDYYAVWGGTALD